MINEKFRIDILGDLEYEDLIADIYFDDHIFATLTQEAGYENMEIEIFPPKNQKCWTFRFLELEEVIQHAKKRLWDLRKIPEDS